MELQYPDDFRCPISLEIMSDPVILSSGHTFDRASIQRWIESGHRTCPVTMLPLPPHPPLIPNHALRSLISNFAPDHPSNPQRCHKIPSADSGDRLKSLSAASLSFPSDPDTLAAVLRLAKRDAAFRQLLADSGAASVLLSHAGDRRRPDLQYLALRVLLHLSLDGDDVRVGLVAEGAVDQLSGALRPGGGSAALAATVLTSLAMVEVNKCTIGAHPSAIAGLAALLRDGKGQERREAATALYELCKFPENRRRAVLAFTVPALIQLAGSGSERAVEVLGLLGKCREGREEMGRVKGFIGVLARVLRYRSPRGVENALSVLNLVCSDGEEMASEARREGVLTICLGLVGEDCGKIAKNALGLARTLEKGELGSFI